MSFFNNKKDDFATKEELQEVRGLFRALEKQITEITTGLSFAKWLLAASIGIVPIFTTLLEGFTEDLQPPPVVPIQVPNATNGNTPTKEKAADRFYTLPNGNVIDLKTGKTIK